MADHDRRRVLVTGFGRFPEAASNPTEDLVAALKAMPRAAHSSILIEAHVLPVRWGATGATLRDLIESMAPEAILMFGLASRARVLRVETRALNRASEIHPDADGQRHPGPWLEAHGPAELRSRADMAALIAAIRATGVAARLSRDAGSYLCNAALWAALAAAAPEVPVGFIHVPPRSRLGEAALLAAALAAILALRLPTPTGQPSPPTQTYLTSR
jgi:pyroglutamyl-peptidase